MRMTLNTPALIIDGQDDDIDRMPTMWRRSAQHLTLFEMSEARSMTKAAKA